MPSSWVSSTLLTGLEILSLSSFQSFLSNNPFILLAHLMDLFPLFFFFGIKKPKLSFSDHPEVLIPRFFIILYSHQAARSVPFLLPTCQSCHKAQASWHHIHGRVLAMLFICLFSFWLHWVFIVFVRAFSSCSEQGLIFVKVCRLLIAKHRL